MNNSGTPGRKVCETRDSWAPATPFGPIQPKSMPICADQPEQPIWQGSDCFSYVCNQDSQSNTSRCVNNNNAEVSSAAKMGVTCDNVEACRVFDIDPLAKYKYVPFASLLALANTASHRNDGTPTGKVSISHQHTYDLNFDPGTISNGASPQTISEFDPITPDKAMGVKSKRVSELEKSCSDDRTGQERDEENNDIAAERVVSNGILYNKQLLEPITDASVSAVSIQIKVNDNAEKDAVDPNKTPQQKPRRKKHRPKVAKEGKRQTPKNCKANPTGTRKYVRKKGLNDSTSAPAEAAGESINLKTTETSMESCRKPLNSDIGLTGDENSACKSTFDSVSVSQAKDFCQSNSTGQLCEGTEVMTPNPMTPKPAASKQNPTVKKKYVRRKGINTEKFSAPIDTKMFEPTKEFCTALNSGMQEQPRKEHSTCKSTFNLDPESMAKDLFTSTELGKGDAVMTLKPVTPQPNHSKEHRMGKRKYVRKKELNKDSTSTPTEVAGISDDLRKPEPAKKSCRRTLNFNVEGEPRNGNSKSKSSVDLHSKSPEKYSFRRGIQSKSILQLGEGIEVIVKNTQAGFAYDLNHSVNQLTKDYISPEGQNQTADSRKENITKGMVQETAGNWEVNAKQVFLQIDSQSSPRRANDSKCSTCTISIGQRQAWEPKRDNSGLNKQADTSSSNLTGVHYLTLQAYQMPEPHFPNIYRKISEKGHSSTTYSSSSCVTAAKNISLETASTDGDVRADSTASDQEKQKTIEDTLALSPVDRLKRKRSRGPTRVRNLVLLTRMEQCMMQQTYPGSRGPLDGDKQQVGNSQIPQICIEEQVAKMHETLARKKHTKRDTPAGSIHTNCNETQKHQKIIRNNHHQFSSNLLGTLTELTWKQMFSVDAITERLKHLDINKESRTNKYQEQKALVLYSRDGTLVPFHGSFDLVKKRHPRPKVQLDEETNRVWKLLMQDIISEGIDGTDEENARRWEEERRVFHGRVDSFIARMHLVQGDRRFTMWKGSVVDSVVGVFLTQNVSDHLSSSAFMSLAANFPLISKKPHHGEETASVIEEPVVHELCPDDTILWNEKMSHQPACGQSSMTLHCTEHSEEREVVCSNDSLESSTSVVSSMNEPQCKLMNPWERVPETYHDVISSQNSVDSSIAQVANGTTSSSNSNSEAGDLTNRIKLNSFSGPNSFVKLLQIVGSIMPHGNYNNRNGNMLSGENSKNEHNQFQTTECDNQREKVIDSDDPKDFSGVSGIPPSCFHPCLLSVEAQSHEIREETRSSGISEKPVNDNMTDQIALMPEFASQTNDATKLSVSSPEAPRYGNKLSSNSMQANKNKTAQHQSGLFGDSRFAMKSLAHAQNKYDNSFSKELNDINDATSKPKGRSVKKEKQNDFDWDSLRRHVEANGRKKERPEHTKDSLDWEAIRCADVNKIADTIKERGMNNKLAERIKDFLNRVVRDHGSIDLEWLREVPPDKAKEYLLSFRGLGLKSVECVRLLTLHHVAFPVDTNVGRIAVRLGWVPLQPLPESLQLHLLELYPVLESIQKYLWPRLCKLDQRTLYELHYQMITFGKVFCTKSKPNCNACPMRGECRHFASAFASSRLALPGPEEKAIVSAKENGTDQNPAMMINQLPLPLPQATELSVAKAETAVNNREPIIEEPATPEPECVQVTENDIEDAFWDDPEEIPTIKLNMNGFTQTLQNYMQENLELQEGDLSKALVALTAEAACIPTPKLKNVSNLRTEHQVYELPDLHPLLEGMDKREPDDPGRYLLAIWTPGEMANSIQPPESRCISSQDHGKLCDEKTCFSCNSVRESEFQIVRGTILIPCRTAMRGSFPLNGTYFQVNEVFADHDSSLKPINVPREWIWNLPRRTVYFGTSIPSIFKGLTTEGIQHCFWRGYVCVRGFDHKTRAPRPLMARLHFPASKLKTAGKADAGHK